MTKYDDKDLYEDDEVNYDYENDEPTPEGDLQKKLKGSYSLLSSR